MLVVIQRHSHCSQPYAAEPSNAFIVYSLLFDKKQQFEKLLDQNEMLCPLHCYKGFAMQGESH